MIAGVVTVASCVEAWIEIRFMRPRPSGSSVASCVEAWIEMLIPALMDPDNAVASCVEAWIEISAILCAGILAARCFQCGLKFPEKF